MVTNKCSLRIDVIQAASRIDAEIDSCAALHIFTMLEVPFSIYYSSAPYLVHQVLDVQVHALVLGNALLLHLVKPAQAEYTYK